MRRTYIMQDGKLVEKPSSRLRHLGVMPDINDFETVDGTHIKGRAGLRAYQRETGLEQVGNDLVNGLDEQGKFQRRIEELPPARRDVIEAMQMVSGGYKPRG